MTNPQKLTAAERAAVDRLNDPVYTSYFINEWLNRPPVQIGALSNSPADMIRMSVSGYMSAVRRMIELEKEKAK